MRTRVVGFTDDNRRRDIRREMVNVVFTVNGSNCAVVDLSLGGFQIADPSHGLRMNQEVVVTSVTDDYGTSLRLVARAEVVRVDRATGNAGCRFIDLSSKAFDVIEALVMHRPLGRRPVVKKKPKKFLGLFGG